jgi:hypothetical protein
MSESLSLTEQPELPAPLQKSAATAFWLSVILPGAGHFYLGQGKTAYWTMGIFASCTVGLVLMSGKTLEPEDSLFLGIFLRTAICLYLFAFFDAFRGAVEVSSGRDRVLPYNPRVAAVLNLTTRGFGYFYLGERKLGFAVFVGLLVAMQAVRVSGVLSLEVVLEIILAALAIHAYRKAILLNPPEETLPPIREAMRRSKLKPVVYGLAGVIVLAYAGLAVLGAVASAVVPNYSRIDQTQSKLDVQLNTTIYTNPKYGVGLRLAGLWIPDKTAQTAFCSLTNQEQAVQVLFGAEGIWPMTSLESFSKTLTENFVAQSRGTFEEQRTLNISGLEARQLTFRLHKDGFELRQGVVLIKKGATVYAVWVIAPALMEENWKDVMGSLPGAVTIR